MMNSTSSNNEEPVQQPAEVDLNQAPQAPAVSLETSETVAPANHPLTQEAWGWYQDPRVLGSGIRPSNYFPMSESGKLSTALGRPLELAEMQSLVVADGKTCQCAICGEQFQPVRYIAVAKRLLDTVSKNVKSGIPEPLTAVVAEVGVWRGSFFCPPGREPFAVCGSPHMYNSMQKRYFMPSPSVSHLVAAFQENKFPDSHGGEPYPHWGLSRAGVEAMVARRRERREERARQEQKVGATARSLFSRPGFRNSPQVEDWEPNRDSGGGHHSYPGKNGDTARRERVRSGRRDAEMVRTVREEETER